MLCYTLSGKEELEELLHAIICYLPSIQLLNYPTYL